MASNTALNLEAIDKALKQHDERCEYPVREIQMNPFEVERLGWDEYRGIPIVGDDSLGTGMFRLLCDRPQQGAPKGGLAVSKKVDTPEKVTA